MKIMLVFVVLATLAMLGLVKPASAQVIPNVRGLTPFTASTNFMSLPGYLRWQYFQENDVWISRGEAISLVQAQGQPVALAR